jgi:hypothetical protein
VVVVVVFVVAVAADHEEVAVVLGQDRAGCEEQERRWRGFPLNVVICGGNPILKIGEMSAAAEDDVSSPRSASFQKPARRTRKAVRWAEILLESALLSWEIAMRSARLP